VKSVLRFHAETRGTRSKYANTHRVGWGFPAITVLKGTNVLSSASLINMKTNDPTTIPGKQ